MYISTVHGKTWGFVTLVATTLLYGVVTWELRRNKVNNVKIYFSTNNWKNLGTPSVSMIAHMIQSKPLVPHEISQAEIGSAPITIEALFQSVPVSNGFGSSLHTGTQGCHLCHQNKLLSMEIFIVGMLKPNNASSHMV